MPELPEVRTVANTLNKVIRNKTIKKVDVFCHKIIKEINVKEFQTKIEGNKIIDVKNIGKWIIVNLNNGYSFIVHLRLEGKFRTTLEGANNKHDHIIFTFQNDSKLYFNDTRKFGTFHLRKTSEIKELTPISNLANEPQNTDINWLFNKLQKKSIPIKSSMLDQGLVVGLGNIYINEVLWKEKINPITPSNKITKIQLKKLLKTSFNIMEKSYTLGGTTFRTYSSLNNKEGLYQNFLMIHNKESELCSECKNPIKKIKVGGRGTYFCPKCQK